MTLALTRSAGNGVSLRQPLGRTKHRRLLGHLEAVDLVALKTADARATRRLPSSGQSVLRTSRFRSVGDHPNRHDAICKHMSAFGTGSLSLDDRNGAQGYHSVLVPAQLAVPRRPPELSPIVLPAVQIAIEYNRPVQCADRRVNLSHVLVEIEVLRETFGR